MKQAAPGGAGDEGLAAELARATRRIADLEAEIDVARVNAQDSEQQIDGARRSNDDLRAQVDAAQESNDDLRAQVDAAQGRHDDLVAQLAEARQTIDDLSAQIERAREQRQELVATADRWRRQAQKPRGLFARLFGSSARPEPVVHPHIMEARREASFRYLRGRGIEIGALHSPIPHSWRARVRYVDRMSTQELYAHYTEFGDRRFAEVDVVDDGEVLGRFGDASLDFIIASHMLEHCENPLGTLRNHLRKLRDGGMLYYVIPEQRGGCDIERPVTPFAHVVRDDEQGPEQSRWDHYLEFARLADKVPPGEAPEVARRMMEDGSSIHFHVWDEPALHEFFERAAVHLGTPYRIEHIALNHVEVIAVLRK